MCAQWCPSNSCDPMEHSPSASCLWGLVPGKYWGCHFLSRALLTREWIKPGFFCISCIAGGCFTARLPGKPMISHQVQDNRKLLWDSFGLQFMPYNHETLNRKFMKYPLNRNWNISSSPALSGAWRFPPYESLNGSSQGVKTRVPLYMQWMFWSLNLEYYWYG